MLTINIFKKNFLKDFNFDNFDKLIILYIKKLLLFSKI